MGALLADVAQRLEDEQRWAEIRAAYERAQREDPDDWQHYLAELTDWDEAGGGIDRTAAGEWPEYNK
jgi:hypothetical protein